MSWYCSECRRPCREVERDFGFGRTEFWGAVATHSNVHSVSECCDGDLLTKEDINGLDCASRGLE
jgi:hypothetical protein